MVLIDQLVCFKRDFFALFSLSSVNQLELAIKKILVIIDLLVTKLAQVQEYKPVNVSLSIECANPEGSNLKRDLLMGIEPK